MKKLADVNEKIAEKVVEGYKKIEDSVVSGYKKIEEGAVEGFNKVTDKIVGSVFAKEGETVEEAKERLTANVKTKEEAEDILKLSDEIKEKQ